VPVRARSITLPGYTGVDLALRVDHFRQAVEPRVRHMNHSHVSFRPYRAQPRSVRVRQGAEQRGLPGSRKTNNPDLQHFDLWTDLGRHGAVRVILP
jgi:hypothetical protein